MTADILFANVEVFGAPSGQRLRVLQEETFTVRMHYGEVDGELEWGSTRDAVLTLNEADGLVLTVKAAATGDSKVFLLNEAMQAVFVIEVEVFSNEAGSFRVPVPIVEPLSSPN